MSTEPEAPPPIVAVRCASWRELAELYAQDLKSGGMFVAHSQPPPLLSTLELHLLLPEAVEIVLRARVVQILAPAQAEQLGKPPGLGLELLDLDEQRKRQIAQLIEFARADDPQSSFAHWLAELSPSLPPHAVAAQLSNACHAHAAQPVRNETRPNTLSAAPRVEAHTRPAPRTPVPPGQSSHSVPARRPSGSMPAVEELRARRYSGQFAMPKTEPRSSSQSSHPAVSGDTHGKSSSRPPAARTRSSQELRASVPPASHVATQAPSESSQELRASVAPSGGSAGARPKPEGHGSDPHRLKLVLSSVAHKHYDAALRVVQQMLAANPNDSHALLWRGICYARMALARNEPSVAQAQYELVLQVDADNREAREFIRSYERDRKLSSLPFGRYFTKKK